MRSTHATIRAAAVVVGVVGAAALPQAQAPSQRMAFEVASVRPSQVLTPARRTITDGRVDLVNYLIQKLVLWAYNIEDYRLVVPKGAFDGNPRVDVRATLPQGSTATQLPEMLRTLLAERFGMVAHFESRPIDVYELVLGPGGLKMREVEAVDDLKTPYPALKIGADSRPADQMDGERRIIFEPDGSLRTITADMNFAMKRLDRDLWRYDAVRARTALLVEMLATSVGKPVIDRTGLKGLYQFQIELPLDPGLAARFRGVLENLPNSTGASITVPPIDTTPVSGSPFKAVEALGLKLQARRVPFDVLVVDKLDTVPTPN